MCVLIAVGLAGRAGYSAVLSLQGSNRAATPAQMAGAWKPIEALRVGDRVWTNQAGVAPPSETEVDARTWRQLVLRAEVPWEDGTVDDLNVETLRPPAWIAAHRPQVGASISLPLDLVEMGLPTTLRAQVVAIKPCPAIAPGPGRVVLTTVNHLNRDVRELTVCDAQGHQERIRPTGLHRFYRETDAAWVHVDQLGPGDALRGRSGRLTVVVMARVPRVHRVYNLTVEGEHLYQVSSLGAFAHNTGCSQATAELATGGNTTTKVTVGGGATTNRITAENARAIQDFVNRYQVEVTVVGSRVNPNKALTPGQSDWDYLINPIAGVKPAKSLREVENSASKYLPRGARRTDQFGNTRNGMDLQRNEAVDSTLPHVTFRPQNP
jgi:hypothetical protein